MSEVARSIAYMIAPHPFHTGEMGFDEPFKIKHSANAWWIDSVKVYTLLAAFRFGATIKEACEISAISKEQWQYFNEVHPEFYALKSRIEVIPIGKALATIHGYMGLEHKTKAEVRSALSVAKWYLSRKDPVRWGSATERLYWAKQALTDEDSVIDRRRNITIAKDESHRSGRTVLRVVGRLSKPLPTRKKDLPLRPSWEITTAPYGG